MYSKLVYTTTNNEYTCSHSFKGLSPLLATCRSPVAIIIRYELSLGCSLALSHSVDLAVSSESSPSVSTLLVLLQAILPLHSGVHLDFDVVVVLRCDVGEEAFIIPIAVRSNSVSIRSWLLFLGTDLFEYAMVFPWHAFFPGFN